VLPENHIFRNGKIQNQPVFVAVLRNISDSHILDHTCRMILNRFTIQTDIAFIHISQTADHLHQFLLAVAVYSGNSKNLSGFNGKA